jgi:hypothetical protein
MTKDNIVHIRLEDSHKKLLDEFQPYFGNSTGKVIVNLALRWIEANLTNPNIVELAKKKAIKLQVGGRDSE